MLMVTQGPDPRQVRRQAEEEIAIWDISFLSSDE